MQFSISKIKLFKACRRAYELRYVEELLPVDRSEALETGSNYHALVEQINKGNFEPVVEEDYSVANAMARAYAKYIYPQLGGVFQDTEKWLELEIGNDLFVGIVDGIAADGSIVEHKTTSETNLDKYEYYLQWDEQILAYMLLTGRRKVYYTVCRKPNIRQKKDETEEQFWRRCVDWYDEDTDNKIRLIELKRTEDEVIDFRNALYEMINEIRAAEASKTFYKNTCHCQKWGTMCEYAEVCLHYDRNQKYIGFCRKE